MTSLAVIGLFQALFIPGILLSLVVSRHTKLRLIDNLLIATPLSLVLNYILVPILVLLNAYTQKTMFVIIGIELVVILLIANRLTLSDIPRTITSGQSVSTLFEKEYLVFFFNVVALGLLIDIYLRDAGSVFVWWDVVVSWNRWAKEWFSQVCGDTMGYPPAVPILYSLVYKLADTTNVQTIAKLVAAYFPFWGIFCIWRLGRLKEEFSLAASIAGILFIYLQVVGGKSGGYVFSGNADPVMAALGVFVLYALFLATEYAKTFSSIQDRKYVVALLSVAVSSIAIVKQPGVPVAVLFALMIAYSYRSVLAEEKKYWTCLALVFGLLVASYYILFYYFWNNFPRADALINEHQILLRPYSAFKLLLAATGKWIWFLVAGSFFVSQWSRSVFFILVVPLYLFWAFLVSYDMRSAFVFFPWIALLAGIALAETLNFGKLKLLLFPLVCYLLFNEIVQLHPDLVRPGSFARISVLICSLYFVWYILLRKKIIEAQSCVIKHSLYLLAGALILCLSVLPFFKKSESLLSENTQKRMRSNDRGFNERLSRLFEQEPDAKMVSCWQMVYNLPASEGRFIPIGNCDIKLAQAWLARKDLEYYLLWTGSDPELLQNTRALLTSRGVSFTEERLADKFFLLRK